MYYLLVTNWKVFVVLHQSCCVAKTHTWSCLQSQPAGGSGHRRLCLGERTLQLHLSEQQVELTRLASCRVKDGDQVWQFHDTRLAFIVRESSDSPTADGYVIVGRASLIKQWRPCEWDAFQSTPEARKWLKSHEIQLSMASLLDLVFWSSSTDAR